MTGPADDSAGRLAGRRAFGPGYDTRFLPFPVPTPTADPALLPDLRDPLPYRHFSVAMSRARRLARWVAWNIDGGTRFLDIPRDDQRFRPDPRIPANAQVLDEVYADNRLDRGHLARRADLLWGTRSEAEEANANSFYFTNITPQMDTFNQAERFGVWGRLEIALLQAVDRQRASVLAGPVLADDDPAYRGVQVPREFWKALAYTVDGTPRVRIFLVTQSLQLEVLPDPLEPFQVYAITADELQQRTGLRLDPALAATVVTGREQAHRRAARLPHLGRLARLVVTGPLLARWAAVPWWAAARVLGCRSDFGLPIGSPKPNSQPEVFAQRGRSRARASTIQSRSVQLRASSSPDSRELGDFGAPDQPAQFDDVRSRHRLQEIVMYLGFDRSSYPGDSVMESLYDNTPLAFVCYYLPSPSHGQSSWSGTFAVLRDQGWGFLPTYVGQQVIGDGSHVVTAAQGVTDGLQTGQRMSAEGFATGTVVYLDIENGLRMPDDQVAYVRSWIQTVNEQTDYWPGVYCSKKETAKQVEEIEPGIPIWVYGPQRLLPTLPGAAAPTVVADLAVEQGPDTMPADYPGATAWQYLMSLNCVVDLRWTDGEGVVRTLHQVDVDCATVADPSFAADPENQRAPASPSLTPTVLGC